MKANINTKNAPQPIGPYSQAVKATGTFIFISGQIPYDKDGALAGESVEEQTRQCIENISSILESQSCTLENVVKTTVLLKDMGDFEKVNEAYNRYFETSKPARAAYQVVKLPKDVLVEIEAIAVTE